MLNFMDNSFVERFLVGALGIEINNYQCFLLKQADRIRNLLEEPCSICDTVKDTVERTVIITPLSFLLA